MIFEKLFFEELRKDEKTTIYAAVKKSFGLFGPRYYIFTRQKKSLQNLLEELDIKYEINSTLDYDPYKSNRKELEREELIKSNTKRFKYFTIGIRGYKKLEKHTHKINHAREEREKAAVERAKLLYIKRKLKISKFM